MLKYKDKYFVLKQKLPNGKPSPNKNDNYIQCKKNGKSYIQIYRYSQDTLSVLFWSVGVANNRIKELNEKGVDIKPFVSGDEESVYLFPEEDLKKVTKVVKARKRRKLTEEQRQQLIERLQRHRSDTKKIN